MILHRYSQIIQNNALKTRLECFVFLQDPSYGVRWGLLSVIVRFIRKVPHHMPQYHIGLTRVMRSHAVRRPQAR